MERIVRLFEAHIPRLAERSADRILAEEIPFYRQFPRSTLVAVVTQSFMAVSEDLKEGTSRHLAEHVVTLGRARRHIEGSLIDMNRGFALGFAVVSDFLAEQCPEDLEGRLFWEQRRNEIAIAAAGRLAETFHEAQTARLREQSERLSELSAPLIPITEGVLVLPIVGSINAARASVITQSLLEAITHHRAQVVIVDITGVPNGNPSVAHHLAQSTHAARLLGARMVLVGISPMIARALVSLGVDLSHTTTLGNLEAGLDYALRLRGLSIAPIFVESNKSN